MSEEAERPNKKPRVQKSPTVGDMKNNDDQKSSQYQKAGGKWRPNFSRGHNKYPSQPQNLSSGHPVTNLQDKSKHQRGPARTFSQPSVITAGDKGIYVTSDKGREKKSLLELGDLIEDYLEKADLLYSVPETNSATDNDPHNPNAGPDVDSKEEDLDIESAINSELNDLSSQHQKPAQTSIKPFQLITLDVPCVSFLRFQPLHPSYPFINPTIIAHGLCNDAMKTSQIRSRNIRRLSPVFHLQKTLNNGLERCADSILPPHFSISTEEKQNDVVQTRGGYKFAIRPTTRNHDKLNRDDVIKFVADRIADLGGGKHKVDLKHYQKGVLVEIYRGWIGMAVVDNETTDDDEGDGFEYGYEELKRFNLAEIYGEAMKRKELEMEEDKEKAV